jgi:hypothetical protein
MPAAAGIGRFRQKLAVGGRQIWGILELVANAHFFGICFESWGKDGRCLMYPLAQASGEEAERIHL